MSKHDTNWQLSGVQAVPAPADMYGKEAQPAEAEGVEVVAYVGCQARMTTEGWENGEEYLVFADQASDADKRYDVPLMTVAQHLAALSAVTAERDRLQQFEAAYNEWHDKTEWVQKTAKAHELGKHRADVLKDRIDQLRAEAEAGEWIPLQKATPPDGVPVLRWPGWAAEFSIDEWCSDYRCFLMSIESGERATHWKPLSAPGTAMAAKEV